MKTAQEWSEIRVAGLWGSAPESSLKEFIHAIQADALRHAAKDCRHAASLCTSEQAKFALISVALGFDNQSDNLSVKPNKLTETK